MLPKSRILSALLVGLGIALIAAGITAPRFLDVDSRMALNAETTTWTFEDPDGTATILSKEGSEPYTGPLTYQLHMDIQEPADKETATLRIGETTLRGTGDALSDVANLVTAQVWSYGVDRLTGEATSMAKINHTIATPAAESPVNGYWLKFPADAQKTNYPVFDPYIRDVADAVFEEELSLEGRTVYRYHQEVEPVNVATKFAGGFNTETVPTEDGGSQAAFLHHSATRDYYVDQETGYLVGMDIKVDDYYATQDGKRLRDSFIFEGSTSDEDRAAFLAQAAELPAPAMARLVFWIMIGLGALIALLGIAGVLGLFGRGAHRRKD